MNYKSSLIGLFGEKELMIRSNNNLSMTIIATIGLRFELGVNTANAAVATATTSPTDIFCKWNSNTDLHVMFPVSTEDM